MNYTPSTHIDPNKVFLIQRSELDGRIDAAYIAQKIKTKRKYNYPTEKLNKLVRSLTGGTPSKEKQEYWDGGIYWVSPKDFKQFYIDKSEDTITELGLNNSSTKLIPANSILIVVRSGVLIHTLPVAINTIPVTINQDIKALIPTNKILPEYLGYYFNVFNSEILPLIVKHSTTVQSVNTNEFDRLEIPVPPIKDQQHIVNILNCALSTKQQKEAEAKALLESIDTYLLGELGISLDERNKTFYFQEPEPRYGIHYKIQKDYQLNESSKLVQEGKIFLTNFSEVTGGRYDPKLYNHNTKGLKRAIENSNFKSELLKNLITQSAAGDWGKDENEVLGNDFIKCLVIRATEFDNQYNLRLDNSRVKYRWIHKDKLARIDIKENDLLIEKSGGSPDQPVGRIAIIKKNMVEKNQLCYSNFIHKIRVDTSKVNPKYLFYLLKTFHTIKLTDSMQSQTNGIRNLIMREYFNQTIPLPFMEDPEKSLEKQTEIANHIQNIHRQAKALQHDAASVLEEAKREVEKMILGE